MALEGVSEVETLTESVNDSPQSLLLWAVKILAVAAVSVCLLIVLFGDPEANRPRAFVEMQPIIKTNMPRAGWSEPVRERENNLTPAQLPAQLPGATTEPAKQGRVILRQIYAGSALVADPSVIENTPQGPLPRIGDNGRTPFATYAAPVPPGIGKKPRVAIVMTGFGLGTATTNAALAALAPAVTLGFTPRNVDDKGDVQNWVNEARSRGHEVLLELPMEPADYPDSDPGPHTLRTGQGEDANIRHLSWALTRFTGYVGVVNLQGGRFLSDAEALSPVMTFLARRGLMFFDDGMVGHSVAGDVARQADARFARGAIRIDAVQDGAAIDRALSELEAKARATGSAVGTAFVYPVTVERLGQWTRGLQSRGFVLVPASAIVGSQK